MARIVSGSTLRRRPLPPIGVVHHPIDYGPRPQQPIGVKPVGKSGKAIAARGNPMPVTQPVAPGARVVSGATKAARAATPPLNTGGSTAGSISTDGSTSLIPAATTGAKSGATIAARNRAALISKVAWGFGIGALVVGSIFLVRKYHLLTGGK